MNAITSPTHYTSLPAKCSGCGKPIECIDVTKHMICCRSAAVKYIWRAGEKDDEIEDLRKAIQYLEFEIGRLGGKSKPVSNVEPHDASRAVDFDRIRFALDNPGLPVPETVQSAPVAAVEPQSDPSPADDGLWRPVAGKYGRTRDGRKVGKIVPNTRPDFFAYPWSGVCGPVIINFDSHGKSSDVFDDCCDLIAEWQDEPALEMREGAWYERRDGEVRGPAERSPQSSRYPWIVGGYLYSTCGSFTIGCRYSQDLIREIPAPDALDAQAIYDNNPEDLVGSVWKNANCCLITLLNFWPYPNNDGEIIYECNFSHSWSVSSLREKGYSLLRLASQEAAE